MFSVRLRLSAQPKWVQRGTVGVIKCRADRPALYRSGPTGIGRAGENILANRLERPEMSFDRSLAATMDEVIPQALNPVETKISGVAGE